MITLKKALSKIILLSSMIITLNADTFEFSSIKKNASGDIVNDNLKVENEKKIIVTGYGTNKQQALDNAFKSAIEQYVGVLIDTETMMKNGKLIKDNILTASNGFIKTYKEISTTNVDGLLEVKINATVKSQNIFNKIKSLKISTISINNAKETYARVSTKLKAKEDSAKILKKVIDDFLSTKSIQEMLEIKITNVKVEEDKAKDNKVPMNITYKIGIDYKSYLQKIKHLEQVFQELGAKLHKRIDLPYWYEGNLRIKNSNKIEKLKSTDFGIIKKYGNGFVLDIWEFPTSWSDIYPFKRNSKELILSNLFQIILEIKNGNNNILFAQNITNSIESRIRLIIRNISSSSYYEDTWYGNGNSILFTPMFSYYQGRTYLNYKFTDTELINIKDISKVKNITIELEEI